MSDSWFIRLTDIPPNDKADDLKDLIGNLNTGQIDNGIFHMQPSKINAIPNSPFAYWMDSSLLKLFSDYPQFRTAVGPAVNGHTTGNDFRFVRAFWEVREDTLGRSRHETLQDKTWVSFAKGGAYSAYYSDMHLVLDWGNDGETLRNQPNSYLRNEDLQFRPGITWPLRAPRFGPVPLPAGSVFSVRGYGAFSDKVDLKLIIGITSTAIFDYCYKLLLGREGYPEFIVGVLLKMPWPSAVSNNTKRRITDLVSQATDIKRRLSTFDETSRIFCRPPGFATDIAELDEMYARFRSWLKQQNETLDDIQARLDDEVFSLYKVEKGSRHSILRESYASTEEIQDRGYRRITPIEKNYPVSLRSLTQDWLMFSLGCAFGRWDIRVLLDDSLLPKLADPFDHLPICPPARLLRSNGMPAYSEEIVSEAWLRSRRDAITMPDHVDGPPTITEDAYPLKIAWDGVLVDDPGHLQDVVAAVRQVLRLTWTERAVEVEREACEILGVNSLRSYLRDPRSGLFKFHIKRYSRSRRKAPIYWLLQTESRSYGVWLYYHRLTPDTLFHVAREYVDPKIALEENRLAELQSGLKDLSGSAQKSRERELADQAGLIEELKAFRNRIEDVAMLELKPDFDDGVILNIAPLWQLVPWNEAEKAWKQLVSEDHEWSTIGQQLRARGSVKARGG
jgi:hypothetical protein